MHAVKIKKNASLFPLISNFTFNNFSFGTFGRTLWNNLKLNLFGKQTVGGTGAYENVPKMFLFKFKLKK